MTASEIARSIGAKGVIVRVRKSGKVVVYWTAASLTTKNRGFRPHMRLVWEGYGQPSQEDRAFIRQRCDDLSQVLREWIEKGRRTRTGRQFSAGYVYFIGCADAVKIGFTTDVDRRVYDMKTYQFSPVEVLLVIPGLRQVERELHQRFSHLRIQREWFRADPELMEFIGKEASSRAPLRQAAPS